MYIYFLFFSLIAGTYNLFFYSTQLTYYLFSPGLNIPSKGHLGPNLPIYQSRSHSHYTNYFRYHLNQNAHDNKLITCDHGYITVWPIDAAQNVLQNRPFTSK